MLATPTLFSRRNRRRGRQLNPRRRQSRTLPIRHQLAPSTAMSMSRATPSLPHSPFSRCSKRSCSRWRLDKLGATTGRSVHWRGNRRRSSTRSASTPKPPCQSVNAGDDRLFRLITRPRATPLRYIRQALGKLPRRRSESTTLLFSEAEPAQQRATAICCATNAGSRPTWRPCWRCNSGNAPS